MSKDLQVIDQKTVLFYEDEITAVRVADGTIYVPIRPICDHLGVNWSGQYKRIQRDPILSDVVSGVVVTPTPLDNKFANPQEMLCLPLQFLNGWLFSINANRVKKEEVRERLLRYQKRVYDVLYEAFQEGRLSTDFDALLERADPDARAAYQMAQAVAKLARQQIMIQSQVDENTQRIDLLEERLEGDDSTITEAQASQISQAVKTVAMSLSERTGRNEYGGVYGELYRRFEITSYKLLPADRFQEAMNWLTEWYNSLQGEENGLPF
jgi:hypothetical protein